jgi:hypothetical protein
MTAPEDINPRQAPIPLGLCQCGCGQKTKRASRTRRSSGWVKGRLLRYVRGHRVCETNRYIVVDTGYATPCWIWLLAKNNCGYGNHRAAYERRYGAVPEGLSLDHLCGHRDCINPDHLEPVSQAENCRRGRNTKLTAAEVKDIRAAKETQRVIARRYGISQSQVSRIRAGLAWRDP